MSPSAEIAPVEVGGHAAVRLAAGALAVRVLPALGMLCASFTRDGVELLGRTDELDAYVQKGSTIAIPFLYPWANRLAGLRYAAAGRVADLDPQSPLLHFDGRGLPMHGVPGAKLAWSAVGHDVAVEVRSGATASDTVERATLRATLAWTGELLAPFPYPHSLALSVALDAGGLEITTQVRADGGVAVPVSFGFHPYFRLAGAARRDWRLELPPLRRLAVDERQIPTGEEVEFTWDPRPLGDAVFDDPFRVVGESPRFALASAAGGIAVRFLRGFPFAQVYAPAGQEFVAIEPMTAPGNALASGRDLPVVAPGEVYEAAFRVEVLAA